MEIITYPAKILRKKSKKIINFSDPVLKSFINELLKTMKKKDGIGLAAPQVGKNIKIIAINTKEGNQIFINPKIIWKSFFKKELGEEGCLSLPQIYGMVNRERKIWIKYQNLNGKKVKMRTEGLLARIFQHEIDHLKGVLFIDKVKEITKGKNLLKKMKNDKE